MTLTSCLYFVEIISNIDCIFSIAFLILILACIAIAVAWTFTLDSYFRDQHQSINKALSVLSKKWWVLVLLVLVNVIVPSKNTMYLMLGTHYLSQSNLPAKVSQALELKLDDVIENLKPKKGDK